MRNYPFLTVITTTKGESPIQGESVKKLDLKVELLLLHTERNITSDQSRPCQTLT